jgi:hypothetical protein
MLPSNFNHVATPRPRAKTPHPCMPTSRAPSPVAAVNREINDAMAAISSLSLLSPKTNPKPKACRSVWQAHVGGISLPQCVQKQCSVVVLEVVNSEPPIPRKKRNRSPPPLPPLDRNIKAKF